MKILVINTGSSSIKFRLFDMGSNTVAADGAIERIGEAESALTYCLYENDEESRRVTEDSPVADHREGMLKITALLTGPETGAIRGKDEIAAIGHRVVHGGEAFRKPTIIDEAVMDAIRRNIPLAPLHNPPNLTGIETAREIFPDTPQVAVFDTAFHQTIPPKAFHYALPFDFYENHRIRRYGFHGTSHLFLARRAAETIGLPLAETNLITIHLGNGASMTAIDRGQSIDTTMGMTPLEGLVMGTRSGDIDPAILFYLARHANVSMDELDSMLNKESGLKGICGENDMRGILRRRAEGDVAADLAVDMYTYRVKKYIGAFIAVLGEVHAIVFSGGIGENAAVIRELCCAGLDRLGVKLDPAKNSAHKSGAADIAYDESEIRILIIPTDEELEIAYQTVEVLRTARNG